MKFRLGIVFFLAIYSAISHANLPQLPRSNLYWESYYFWSSSAMFDAGSHYQHPRIGIYNKVPHYSQPTNNTCGATVLAMLQSFKYYKHNGSYPSRPDIISIYNSANTDTTSGLSTAELKTAINQKNLGVYYEMTRSSVESAIDTISYQYNPTIIYGNTSWGSAGGHYYLSPGGISCNLLTEGYKQMGCAYTGLYIHDSVYGSPAFTAPPPPNRNDPRYRGLRGYVKYVTDLAKHLLNWGGIDGLSPNQYYTADEFAGYWKKTGAVLPWNDRHSFLLFSKM